MTNNLTVEEKITIWLERNKPMQEALNKDYWINTLMIELNRNDLIEILLHKEVATKQDYFKWWSWSELCNGVNMALGLKQFNEEVLSY